MPRYIRAMLVAVLGGAGLLASALMPRETTELALVEAAYPEAPPLHVSVPTEPFRAHQ